MPRGNVPINLDVLGIRAGIGCTYEVAAAVARLARRLYLGEYMWLCQSSYIYLPCIY